MELTLEELRTNEETRKHIINVAGLLQSIAYELCNRALKHDASKLVPPEVSVFTEYTPKLKGTTYGSEEYKKCLSEMGKGLRHHYDNNRHHPEHFEDGVEDMNLVDLIEMVCDWKAASFRHNDGDFIASVEHNEIRFGLGYDLVQIIKNTADLLDVV